MRKISDKKLIKQAKNIEERFFVLAIILTLLAPLAVIGCVFGCFGYQNLYFLMMTAGFVISAISLHLLYRATGRGAIDGFTVAIGSVVILPVVSSVLYFVTYILKEYAFLEPLLSVSIAFILPVVVTMYQSKATMKELKARGLFEEAFKRGKSGKKMAVAGSTLYITGCILFIVGIARLALGY